MKLLTASALGALFLLPTFAAAQDAFVHPPFQEWVQLPLPAVACTEPTDPEIGVDYTRDVANRFEELTADGGLSESELPIECRLLPPGMPVMFLWPEADTYQYTIFDVDYEARLYGAETVAGAGLWYVLVVLEVPPAARTIR